MEEIVIFGAGNYGYQALLYYGQKEVVFFVDNDPNKKGKVLGEKVILSFDEYLEKREKYKIIIACGAFEKVIDQLKDADVSDYVIFHKVIEKRRRMATVQNELGFKDNLAIEELLENKSKVVRQVDKVFFVGDNTDTKNLGCRATSKALYDLIRNKVHIIDVLRRNEITSCFFKTDFKDDSIYDYYMYIRKYDQMWIELKNRIEKTDAVVFNGEGSFIFQSPPRYDTYIYLCIMLLCIESGKPFYLLNAMFSYGTGYERNENLLKNAVRIFGYASLITARDPYSMSVLQQVDEKKELVLRYVPDALFSWYDLFEREEKIFDNLILNYQYCMAFDHEELISSSPIDFSKEYVLLSGNSYVASYPEKGKKIYESLAERLNSVLEMQNMKLYIMECCSGENFLRQVSEDTGIPIIKAQNNIYLMGAILQHARCYVSGRYHPSILASLGGTPCVFMGSNSHKTESLQEVLQYEERCVFPAMPKEHDIKKIIEYTLKVLSKDDLRSGIKEKCLENQSLAKNIPFLCGF